MASIQDIQQDIIDEFDMFEEWMGKYEHIIDLGKGLPIIEEQFKTEVEHVEGGHVPSDASPKRRLYIRLAQRGLRATVTRM